ncbi:sugar phosphotransferase [Microbacterium sp. CH12i]|uniref:stealth conserved region 3 domain-containing protein n=1 Tax=Microbacterium sp. CH12i TaxID=1479651 RepID=UPI000460AD30|nr:stealth conserved region 3 domain-containing protein [Microbacterium sp. CH12i]KDA06373.1 sugar phosphotransferase [Microbacterium sp. CH12i]
MPTLTLVPEQPHPWSALLDRDDVVLDGGVLHIVHDSVTPQQARIDDLLLVAAALEDTGIEVVLIRSDHFVPALAVDVNAHAAVIAALAAVCDGEPLYIKAKQQPPVLASEASAPLAEQAADPRAVRVYRPRITTNRSLRYGASLGVRVEFWRLQDDLVEAPNDNVLTRRVIPRDDLSFTTIERYGRQWRTIAGMFDPQAHEFIGDVDMVFSWVDGSTSEFQRQRAAQMAEYVVGEGDDGPARYRHVDELRYALRSVHMYAPWVRRIFIATDSAAPAWLVDHPKVTLMRSEEFFPDPSVLPTHNSHAVESQLHRIPGIAEHFIYANDDMFFGRSVSPELFFTSAGVTKFVESEVRIGTGIPAPHRSGHDNGLRVNRELLRARFGRTITRDLSHCATPLRKSVMAELEREFPEDFERTAASRFRSADDISVTNSLFHYYALMTGRAVATREPRVRYVQTTLAASLRRMERLAESTDVDMFCLNDGGETELPEEVRIRAIRGALDRMFPVLPPWERADVSDAGRSAQSENPSLVR